MALINPKYRRSIPKSQVSGGKSALGKSLYRGVGRYVRSDFPFKRQREQLSSVSATIRSSCPVRWRTVIWIRFKCGRLRSHGGSRVLLWRARNDRRVPRLESQWIDDNDIQNCLYVSFTCLSSLFNPSRARCISIKTAVIRYLVRLV